MNCLCSDCGAILNDEERYYYSDSCETCELARHQMVMEWRYGRLADEELDEKYSNPKPELH